MSVWMRGGILALALSSGLASANLDEQPYAFDFTALAEPSLRATTGDMRSESYRFLWHSQDGSGISLRLAIDPEGTGRVIARHFTTEAGQIKPKGEGSVTEVTRFQVITFRAYLKIADFWRLSMEDEFGMNSGNVWVLEGAYQGNYRWLKRFAPRDMYFRDAGLYLVELVGLSTEKFLVPDPITGQPTG